MWVTSDDPVRGIWSVSREELNALVDTSALATGVVLEKPGDVLEDAWWLRSTNDAHHINLAELDTTLKGLNLALQWRARIVHSHTDSVCIYHRLTNALTGRARVRTKASSEMVVRRSLMILQQLIHGYSLQVDVTYGALEQSTQVPKKCWS